MDNINEPKIEIKFNSKKLKETGVMNFTLKCFFFQLIYTYIYL